MIYSFKQSEYCKFLMLHKTLLNVSAKNKIFQILLQFSKIIAVLNQNYCS